MLPYRKMVEYKAYEAVHRERVKRSTFWRSFFGALTLGHFGAALGWASSQKPGDDRWVVWDKVTVDYTSERGITTCFPLKSVGGAGELELEKEILRNAPFAAFLKNGEFGQLGRRVAHEGAACGMSPHALPCLAARV